MGFSGTEVSEKGFPKGWNPDADDLASQRIFRVTQLLEAMVFRPWSWDIFNSLNLKYAFHGGYIDGSTSWVLIPDGTVLLVDDATNYVERDNNGAVTVNQVGFTYTNSIPMAEIKAANGKFVLTSYVDYRPDIGGAPAGAGASVIPFTSIAGMILTSQVSLDSVKQWESFLSINFTQLVGVATRAQLPPEVAYEDEVNIFTVSQVFQSLIDVTGISTLRSQVRRGIRTITAADTPYTLVTTDWHLNIDTSIGAVEVLVPDAAAHFSGGFTDQLHFKLVGSGSSKVTLTPAAGGQLIDGFNCAILRNENRSFTLVSDGSDWWIQ